MARSEEEKTGKKKSHSDPTGGNYNTKKRSAKQDAGDDMRVKKSRPSIQPEAQVSDSRYEDLKHIDRGSFGTVCTAIDNKTELKVAIKELNRPFKSVLHVKRALRELKLLQFACHENVLSLVDAYTTATSSESMKDLFFVTAFSEINLKQYIEQKSVSNEESIPNETIQLFTYQILRGIKYLHSANIIHRDLKPNNIIVDKENMIVRIIDFGLSRGARDDMSTYEHSKCYRAPELRLHSRKYTTAVDMWSMGCVLGEMLLGETVFGCSQSHQSDIQIFRKQIEICGVPDEETLEVYKDTGSFLLQYFLKEVDNSEDAGAAFAKKFPEANESCLDLLKKLLVFNPKHRLTAEQSLNHKYLYSYHDPADEGISAEFFNDAFENFSPSEGDEMQHFKKLIFDDLQLIKTNTE